MSRPFNSIQCPCIPEPILESILFSILYKKPDKKPPDLFSFLSPLSLDVWIYTGMTRLSPFLGAKRPPQISFPSVRMYVRMSHMIISSLDSYCSSEHLILSIKEGTRPLLFTLSIYIHTKEVIKDIS